MPKDSGIGAPIKRREDVRFLTGTGQYTDDVNVQGQAYVYFLRSSVAHGKIKNIDITDASKMQGVVRIFTGVDFEGIGGIPTGWQVTDRHGDPMQEPQEPLLRSTRLRRWEHFHLDDKTWSTP